MLDYFRGRIRQHGRKLRLFAVACCRRIWPYLSDERSRKAVDVAERFADDLTTEVELCNAFVEAEKAHRQAYDQKGGLGANTEWAAMYATDPFPFYAAERVSRMATLALIYPGLGLSGFLSPTDEINALHEAASHLDFREPSAQANLLRDIFGNPFHPVTFNLSWVTPSTIAIAQFMYDTRNFQDMSILSDALEEAGCDNRNILQHCRDEGVHVKGCWLVDLLLGKK